MPKRSQSEGEQESKRAKEESLGDRLNTFFEGKRPDDVFLIVRRDYNVEIPVLDVYLETKKHAKDVLRAVKARDKRNAKDYRIMRLRRLGPDMARLMEDYVNQTEAKQ